MDSWTLCGLMNVQFSWRPIGDSAVTRGENHLSIRFIQLYCRWCMNVLPNLHPIPKKEWLDDESIVF